MPTDSPLRDALEEYLRGKVDGDVAESVNLQAMQEREERTQWRNEIILKINEINRMLDELREEQKAQSAAQLAVLHDIAAGLLESTRLSTMTSLALERHELAHCERDTCDHRRQPPAAKQATQ